MNELDSLTILTSAHLRQLSEELNVPAPELNTKGEVGMSLHYRGHAQELALAVSESVGVVMLTSYIGTVADEERVNGMAALFTTLNLSIADTGGVAFSIIPTSMRIYATYCWIGQVPYESFRAGFARMVEMTSVWRSRMASDPQMANLVKVSDAASI